VALATVAALLFLDRLISAARADVLAVDFKQTFLPAGDAILHGHSPYPAYGYPPLVAFLSAPFALLSNPGFLVTALLVASVPLSLWLFEVRDWRCYAAVFLWVSVFNAIQTANVTLFLLVGAACCWRWRDRRWRAATSGGLAFAAKIVAWPLALWLVATRRLATAVLLVVVAAGVTFGLWATLGFSGLLSYPDSLSNLQQQEGTHGYTLKALAVDLGASDRVGAVLAVGLAVAVLAAVLVFGRRGDDARSFACAVCAFIVASPIIWLHSFALLVAPLAVLRPRLTWVWLLPGALWFVSPGTGNGAPWQTAVTLGVAAVVVVEALRPNMPLGPGRVRAAPESA
jgi:Glycosyltransferase family 87